MRLILKLVLAVSIVLPTLPSAANAQFLNETERAMIWERERGRSLDRQRADEYRLERERARNYYDGGNMFFNTPRYSQRRYHNSNDGAAAALGVIGLAAGVIVGSAIANSNSQPQRQNFYVRKGVRYDSRYNLPFCDDMKQGQTGKCYSPN